MNRENEPPRWLRGVSPPGGVQGRHFFEETGSPPLALRRAAAVAGALALAVSLAITAGALW